MLKKKWFLVLQWGVTLKLSLTSNPNPWAMIFAFVLFLS